MNAYFDTAIILKLYVQEATSHDAVRLAKGKESLLPQLPCSISFPPNDQPTHDAFAVHHCD